MEKQSPTDLTDLKEMIRRIMKRNQESSLELERLGCKVLGCVRNLGRDFRGIDTMLFPKDYFLFRSAPKGQGFVSPSWYSDEAVALSYLRGRKCKRFIAKRDLLLVNITDIESIKAMLRDPYLTDEDRYVISYVTGVQATADMKKRRDKNNYEGGVDNLVFSSVGFLSEDDRRLDDYVNKKFAKALCKLGYDGWIILNETVIDGTHGYFFSEEIMLCKPADVLIETEIECEPSWF